MAKSKKSTKSSRRTARRSVKKSSSWRLYLTIGTVSLAIFAVLIGLAGWIGYEWGREEATKQCRAQVSHYREDIARLRRKLEMSPSVLPKTHKHPPAQKVAVVKEKETRKGGELSEIRDYTAAGGGRESSTKIAKPIVKTKRPELAIVIDDVAYPSQLDAIRALPWPITPSLFPPSKTHPKTPRMASRLTHYMIHLPMEAMHYNHPEKETLTTHSTAAQIDVRMRNLRHWFPNARFINNHTGSRFTSDLAAMQRFYPIARRYGFVFVDSRTTPKTVVPRLCKAYHDPYVARDIFLDNRPDLTYIRNQLKKAVRIAKAHGYAIAIGHPHASTLKALARSGDILKEVDVVYIDQLYKKIR